MSKRCFACKWLVVRQTQLSKEARFNATPVGDHIGFGVSDPGVRCAAFPDGIPEKSHCRVRVQEIHDAPVSDQIGELVFRPASPEERNAFHRSAEPSGTP